jgi:hypothetical protein
MGAAPERGRRKFWETRLDGRKSVGCGGRSFSLWEGRNGRKAVWGLSFGAGFIHRQMVEYSCRVQQRASVVRHVQVTRNRHPPRPIDFMACAGFETGA